MLHHLFLTHAQFVRSAHHAHQVRIEFIPHKLFGQILSLSNERTFALPSDDHARVVSLCWDTTRALSSGHGVASQRRSDRLAIATTT